MNVFIDEINKFSFKKVAHLIITKDRPSEHSMNGVILFSMIMS